MRTVSLGATLGGHEWTWPATNASSGMSLINGILFVCVFSKDSSAPAVNRQPPAVNRQTLAVNGQIFSDQAPNAVEGSCFSYWSA